MNLFTQVAECSIRRKRTLGSSLPKWPRLSGPNGFHRRPSGQLPVRLHSELLQTFCKVYQPTPRHCLRDTQPTTKPGLSLEWTEQKRRRIPEPEDRDCSSIDYLGIRNLPVQPFAEHLAGIARRGRDNRELPCGQVGGGTVTRSLFRGSQRRRSRPRMVPSCTSFSVTQGTSALRLGAEPG